VQISAEAVTSAQQTKGARGAMFSRGCYMTTADKRSPWRRFQQRLLRQHSRQKEPVVQIPAEIKE